MLTNTAVAKMQRKPHVSSSADLQTRPEGRPDKRQKVSTDPHADIDRKAVSDILNYMSPPCPTEGHAEQCRG